MSQTKTASLIEALTNIFIGFSINYTANLIILPLFGFAVTYSSAFGIVIIFTMISLVRSYVLRRWFNQMLWGHK